MICEECQEEIRPGIAFFSEAIQVRKGHVSSTGDFIPEEDLDYYHNGCYDYEKR